MLSRLVWGIEEKEDQPEALGHVVKPGSGGALGMRVIRSRIPIGLHRSSGRGRKSSEP